MLESQPRVTWFRDGRRAPSSTTVRTPVRICATIRYGGRHGRRLGQARQRRAPGPAGARRPAPRAQDPVGPDCPARHCWVSGAVDAEGVKRPGLLLEWRQVAGRWEGRVTYAARLRPLEANGGWLVVEEWLPAELLTPC